MKVDALIRSLEGDAHRLGISKCDLAKVANVHPNSLRFFRGHGTRANASPEIWSPTTAVLRKVEMAIIALKKADETSASVENLPADGGVSQPRDNTSDAGAEA